MNRHFSAGAMVVVGFALFVSTSSGQHRPREITDRDGNVIEVLGPEGRPRDGAVPTTADEPSPSVLSRRAQTGEAANACVPPSQDSGYVVRESQGQGFTVDSCGRIRSESDQLPPPDVGLGPEGEWLGARASAAQVTIDRMTTRVYPSSYSPGGPITLLGSANVYE